MKLYLTTLGCARNQVDSEVMLGRLLSDDWQLTRDPVMADVIVINTCSFIESAADESIERILNLVKYRTEGRCRRLIVTGCLPERYGKSIVDTLPEVDLFLGTGAFDQVVQAVKRDFKTGGCLLPDPDLINLGVSDVPRKLTDAYLAYVKVAEGCSRRCTYCVIPRLRGRTKSRPFKAIISEVKDLISGGVKEIVLVAQDTTAYGAGLGAGQTLAGLLSELAALSSTTWIRFLYGHPQSITTDVMDVVAAQANICSYFDLPVQHANSGILQRMGRNYTKASLYSLFESIRKRVAGASLRTTVMVGFPGESDADFEELLAFVKQIRFDHLGVFCYSDSKDLDSHRLDSPVPPEVAAERYDHLMALQLEISKENIKRHIGHSYPVLLEGHPEKGIYIGRCVFQAPEVDGITIIHAAQTLEIGSFQTVRIIDSLTYDLVGDAI